MPMTGIPRISNETTPSKPGKNRLNVHVLFCISLFSLIFILASFHDSAVNWHPFYVWCYNTIESNSTNGYFHSPAYSRKDTADVINAFQDPSVFLFGGKTMANESSFLSKSNKLILLWFDGATGGARSIDSWVFSACLEKRCSLTMNADLFNQSDAVLFYANIIQCGQGTPPEPKRAFPGQIFTFVMGESPPHAPVCGYLRNENFFNWTMTYRLDSDIRAHYTYSVPVERRPRDFTAGKRKLVAWIVSHCITHGLREKYVTELAKYIPVDVYGKCGHLSCGDNCLERLKEYKFYLAFENSLCKEYVTEKIVNALEHETVPVVYGDGNYHIYPPNSYIHAFNFSSPQKLAEYLLKLDRNKTAYNELMKWRYNPKFTHSHGIYSAKSNGFCELCRKLHAPNLLNSSKSYFDISHWWIRGADVGKTRAAQAMCRKPDWPFLLKTNSTDR